MQASTPQERERTYREELLARPPPVLYKYMSFSNYLEPILAERRLHLQSPLRFNDPYDCIPRIITPRNRSTVQLRLNSNRRRVQGHGDEAVADANLKRMLRMSPDELAFEALDSWHHMIGSYGVSCFSELRDCPLMWSHYGASHSGVCIAFQADKIPKSEEQIMLRVYYRDERAEFHFPRSPKTSNLQVLRALNTKAKWWSYEREWRFVKRNGADTGVSLPSGTVTGITLGARSPEDARATVMDWLAQGYPGAVVDHAVLDQKTFGLAFRPTS